ncbi:response regulator [uncultured Rikenella sp.]|uniref:T9SS response regulator signal transducer PorX n=2 Tax=uncultured Rikenella sp. TaxID=368003 RepID=UPI00272975DD|nr:response regulator [uncultured Rikenella sp.]
MTNVRILWVDDEIELLKPHLLFLQNKGYEVETSNNGYDAVEMVQQKPFDLIILDEMMPGMTGLETLPRIKEHAPTPPVVMVTKSEEENIMDKAVGSKIADYLIKPVNPNQVLLSIKKNVHQQQLVSEKSTADYRSDFGKISVALSGARTFGEWTDIYRRLVQWDIELSESNDSSVREILSYQFKEANDLYARFVRDNYLGWFDDNDPERPVLSHTLLRQKLFPVVDKSKKTTFLLIDNFRYDQWLMIRPLLHNYFDIAGEEFYCAILPTATQYARNALFAGLTPLAISKLMPDLWLNDNQEGGKNRYEEEFLRRQLQQLGKPYRMSFDKLVRPEQGKKLLENIDRLSTADLSVVVYNFLDILSHARTESEIIRELAEEEVAFRSLTRSWFEHSDLWEIMKQLSERGHTIVITSDHGTIRVDNPVKVIGDRETSPNLRYKSGRNLNYDAKQVFAITRPEEAHLPKSNLTSTYIFAYDHDFLVYPNNFNQHVRYYKNTFQHGGISMEEMLVPYIVLNPK